MSEDRTTLDLWFDPLCPWAWMTSRWALEVAKVRAVDVQFHVMSLSALNEGRELPSGYRELMDKAWSGARVALAVQANHPDKLTDFYTALGTRLHPGGQPNDRTAHAAALAEAGLPTELATAGDSDEADDALRAANAEVAEQVGTDVGTPVIRVNGMSLFGPVISPAPKGEEAGRLWDGFLNVLAYPGFFELKRSRTVDPIFD
ncbi:MAG TPA: disulfide bond formation protein DsbA [Propionicimonas sp.]|nr:disulfide bond formation protein DsbA [Propionicimonas sp.]HRA05233.1 disulfide bond formation protein DsbA [Propionicimonas sp.]